MEAEKFSALSNPEVLTGLKSGDSGKSSASFTLPKTANKTRNWQWAYPTIEGVAPSPRGGHSATLVGASLIIFGGHYYAGKNDGFVYLNDTIVLDVNDNRWYRPKLNGIPPPARYGHSAVLAGSRIVIFAGRGPNSQHFRDLHALDPLTMTWYQGPEGGNAPLGRLNHSASLIGTKMFVFGGWNKDSFFNDLFVLDLAAMAWTQPDTSGPSPTPRMGHVATVIGNNILIQGGFFYDKSQNNDKMGTRLKESYLNDLRVLDTETFVWSRLRVSGVPPRHCYGHTMDISGSDILVFGGYGMFQKQNEDVTDYFVVMDTDTMTWNRLRVNGTPPQPRYGHTATPIGPHLLVFGGWEKMKAMNDVFVIRDMSAVPNKNA